MPTTPRAPVTEARGTAPLAYYWGDDAYGLEAAVEALRNDPARFPGGPPERWRPEAERTEPGRLLGEIRERLATGSMFGGGSLAILRSTSPKGPGNTPHVGNALSGKFGGRKVSEYCIRADRFVVKEGAVCVGRWRRQESP